MSGDAKYPIKRDQPSVESTVPPGMPIPKAPGEQHMGGVHKGDQASGGMLSMKGGAAHLGKQMERHLEHEKHGYK